MDVSELIEELKKMPQGARVVKEVDGDSTRTGNFMDADDIGKIMIIGLTFGGYDDRLEKENTPTESLTKRL